VIPFAIVGADGRLGRALVEASRASPTLRLTQAIVRPGSPRRGLDAGLVAGGEPLGVPLTDSLSALPELVVEAALPVGLAAVLDALGGRALVSASTGLDGALEARLAMAAQQAPVLSAANFSLGVALLAHLVRRAAAALPEAEIEVLEVHHRAKRDSPSGTALLLAQAAAAGRGSGEACYGRVGPREPDQIGLASLRCGDVVGEHTVWLGSPGERLELRHVASHRGTFARGALRAGAWLAGRAPGRYHLDQVLGLTDF
jgi:4-hydroxy-tetrahydrodipicolinate reductase